VIVGVLEYLGIVDIDDGGNISINAALCELALLSRAPFILESLFRFSQAVQRSSDPVFKWSRKLGRGAGIAVGSDYLYPKSLALSEKAEGGDIA
jgi:hypothetical protein